MSKIKSTPAKKRKPAKRIIRKQTFTLEVVSYSDNTAAKKVKCNGFLQYELVGLLNVELRDALAIQGENAFKK